MGISSVVQRALGGGRNRTPPFRANLLAWYKDNIVDGRLVARYPKGGVTPQVKGSLFSVAAPEDVTLTGLLTTDVITASGTAPTCAVNGTLSMTANFWDMRVHRAGVLWAYLPGINIGGAFELDASGNGHHLYLTTTTIVEALDGSGTNYANEGGFSARENLVKQAPVDNTVIHVSQFGKYYKIEKTTNVAGGSVSIISSQLRPLAKATTYSAKITVRKMVGFESSPFALGWYTTSWSGLSASIESGPGTVGVISGIPNITGLSATEDTVIIVTKNNFVIGAALPNLWVYPAGIAVTTIGDGALIKDFQICESAVPRGFTRVYNTEYGIQPKAGLANSKDNGLVVCIGDSLTTGYVPYIQALNPVSVFRPANVSGELSAATLTRFPAAVVDQGANVAIIFIGTNDAYGGTAIATVKSNINAMIALCLANNIIPILSTLSPSSAHAGYNATIQAYIDEFNAWIVTLGYPVADIYTAWRDGETDALLAAYDSGDGLHPNAAGSAVESQVFSDLLPAVMVDGDALHNVIQFPGPLNVSATITAGTTYPDITIKAPLGPEFQGIGEWTGEAAVDLTSWTGSDQTRIGPRGMLIYDQPLTYADAVKADRYLGYSIPAEVVHLWNAADPTVGAIGPQPVYAAASQQPDANGNLVTWPNYVPGRGVEVHPAYSNLFTAGAPAVQGKTLTAQKYCLQVFGTGAECVAGAYGTATTATPLIFTATAGDTTFTPTTCERWMLTAAGGYVFSYVAPGVSVASTASTSAGNGLAIPLDARMTAALSAGGRFTATALVWMGVGSGEMPATSDLIHFLICNESIQNMLFASNAAGVNRIVRGGDGTNLTFLAQAWNRGEIHLKVVQTNAAGTQFRVGNRRYTSAMVPIDALTWGAWVNYDGSMQPLTHLRFGYNSTVPLGFLQTQTWAKSCTDAEILSLLRYAV